MLKYVTSMGTAYFDKCGRQMLESFVDNWPEGKIHVYSEDGPLPFEHERVEYHQLLEVDGCAEFLRRCNAFPVMSGHVQDKILYTHNLQLFARKVFSWLDAAADYKGPLVWLDGDIITHKPIPLALLEEWLLGHFMCVMKRKTWHMCSSFMMFDCGHEIASVFFQHVYETYVSGLVLTLPQWDDAYVIEQIIQQTPGIRDIAANVTGEGPYNVLDLVFGGLASHLKGNLKEAEQTDERLSPPKRYQHLIDEVQRLQPDRVLEIGTLDGGRALQMHAAAPGMEYVGFDLFAQGNAVIDKAEKNVKPHYDKKAVAQRLEQDGMIYHLWEGLSKDTLPLYLDKFGEKSADLIYIDGGHSVDTIESDLTYALLAVKEGGVIIMDDYYTNMPEDHLRAFGCQAVLNGTKYELYPTIDQVVGGGNVQMVKIQC